MEEKDLLGAYDGKYDQFSSDDDSDTDSDTPVTGHLVAPLDVQGELVEDLPRYICTICLLQCKGGETASPDICQHTFCLLQALQVAKTVTSCPAERRPFDPLVVRRWLSGQLVSTASVATAAATAAVSLPDDTVSSAERETVWQSSLGSGASSGDDSDWEGGDGGPVGTVRRRHRVSHSRALSRLKRRSARPLPASCRGLLRSHADRPSPSPSPLPPLPVLHSAGVQPAGGAAGDRSASPSGAPAAHQDARDAAGCDTRLSGVANGEAAGGEAAGGPPGGAPADSGGGGGRPLALKTVIDDGLRAEPDRTDDGLEDVSADEGVEDDQTSTDCPLEPAEAPPGGEPTPAAAAAAAAGRLLSLDDVSDEETPADNGIGHEGADAAADGGVRGENGAHDHPQPSDTTQRSSGVGVDDGTEGAGTDEAAAAAGGGEEATDAPPRVVAGTEEAAVAGTEEATVAGTDEAAVAGTDEAAVAGTEEAVVAGTEEAVVAGTEEATVAGTDEAVVAGTEEAAVASGGEEAADAPPREESTDATEEPSSSGAEQGTECLQETSAAQPDEESSDVDSTGPATAAASPGVVSDAKDEDADVGTDVEDEPSEADTLQDIPIDPHPETEDSSPNQRLAETGAGEGQARSVQQEVNPPDVVTSSETDAGGLDVSVDNSPDESRKASDRHSAREVILPGHEYDRVSDSGDDDPAAADAGPDQTDVSDDPQLSGTVGGAAADPLASPVYSPVMSPVSVHSLDSVASPDRPPATVTAETPAGHCASGVADASDVSSDEELVRGESSRPPADPPAKAGSQGAGSWQLLPVESISSPESFGPDHEEPEEPKAAAAEPEPEPEEPPAEAAAVAGVETAAGPTLAPAPAPLLCLGTEQISDNEEDGFDDGMEEGEIPSERPPTPPPPVTVVLPPPVPMPEPDLQRPLDEGGVYPDSDLPEGDFEEGEIPSELPSEPAEPPERTEEPPAAETASPPPAASQIPLSPADEQPPEGDYEEGEIVEERPPSADELVQDAADSPPPPRPASGGEEPAGDVARDDSSPAVRPAVPAGGPQATVIDDDDAPDVDEEVRDFVVSEKTIAGLELDEGDDVGWKKFSRSARGRNYRDGKPVERPAVRSKEMAEPRYESRRSPAGDGGRRGKKREIQRYDVRKVITERKMRAQENQERGGHARRSRSSSSSGSRSPRRAGQRWRRSRSPSRSRSPGRRQREHRRRSRDRRSPPRRDRSRHSVSRHSPPRLSHSRHSHSRHSLSRSPPPHKRTLSPAKKAKDKSRERKRKHSASPALATKKLKKRKDKLKKKDEKKKKKKRPKSPISKAVIVDGDNLVVSVNFSSKDHRDRLGTKSRVVRHEEREPSPEFSPVREQRPARPRDLPTPSKDKRLPVRDRDRDRDLPRRDRDRDERAKPPRAGRPERELSSERQQRDARKENKDPKQSTRAERKQDGNERRSPSPRPARGSKRPRSVTPQRDRRSLSPRARAFSPRTKAPSPRPAPRGRGQSPRSPRARLQSSRVRATSPRARTPSPRSRALSPRPRALSPRPRALSPRPRALSPRPRALSPRPRALSPRPRALSPRNRAASPRARSRSRSSDRPRKYARRSRSGSRSSSWSRSSASSDSPATDHRPSGSTQLRRPRLNPAVIDLDVIEVSPRRNDPIVITDSETEAEPAARPAQARAAAPTARPAPAAPAEPAASRVTARSPRRGPKTPPEPTVKFSLSSKLAVVRTITNPLREEDDGMGSSPTAEAAATTPAAAAPTTAAATQPASAAPRGPSTPPEPPPSDASEAKFGDQYDPFEPTHSPSGTPDSPPSPDLASPELAASPAPDSPSPAAAEKLPPPPLPAEQRDKPAEKPPEPRHPAVVEKRPASHAPPAAPPVASLFAGLPPPSAVSLLSSVLNSVLDSSRQPPSLPAAPAPAPASATKAAPAAAAAPPLTQNGQRDSADVIDMDIDSPFSPDSPNSPDSREGDDLFEPPRPPRGSQPGAGRGRGRGRRMDPKERFEALFGGSHGRAKAPSGKSAPGKAPPGKPVPGKTPSGKPGNKQRTPARGGGRLAKRPAGGKGAAADAEDALRAGDDVPNSAVEMQVKEKFLKKLNRQERVIEEVKLVLKPFYHKRTITKEQYKETLRKSVPKICHNKHGEINPKKIHSLIISYVKKCKYINKKNHITVPNPKTSTPAKGKV